MTDRIADAENSAETTRLKISSAVELKEPFKTVTKTAAASSHQVET
jgi:hypothetical protein